FSPDGRWLAVGEDGVYEVETGQKMFSISGRGLTFSPDGRWLAVSEDGMYELETGEKKFSISGSYPVFSPDGHWLSVANDGVYDVAMGEKIFDIPGGYFSSDSKWLITGGNLYNLNTGEKFFDLNRYYSTVISPDGRWVAAGSDGLYDLETGEKQFDIKGYAYGFSSDGRWLATGNAVYDVDSGQKHFSVDGSNIVFSPDGRWLAVLDDGLYDLTTGEKRFSISGFISDPRFSSDGIWLSVPGDGVYHIETGQKALNIQESGLDNIIIHPQNLFFLASSWEDCFVYGLEANPWPYRVGTFYQRWNIEVFSEPNGTVIDNVGGPFAVYKTTFDDRGVEWLCINPECTEWLDSRAGNWDVNLPEEN
ncbi:MAG: hypothetical protein K8I82_13650, partial [Anaerolineae bacterium]|nr:hypothetical protein [Anaerolineae bacterium]